MGPPSEGLCMVDMAEGAVAFVNFVLLKAVQMCHPEYAREDNGLERLGR